MNEVHFLKQQIRMIPNAPNSEIPSITQEEEDVIIESVPYDDSLHSHLNDIKSTTTTTTTTTTTLNDNDNDNNNNNTDNNTTSSSNNNSSNNNSSNNDNKLKKPIRCYICHEKTQIIHQFYHKMCCKCGEFNLEKRNQLTDMRGKICLVTGGRIKIGYYTALKLLRCGAEMVIVTSRFPKDTAKRYSSEHDFYQWKDHLKIYGIDFKHIPSVVKFTIK